MTRAEMLQSADVETLARCLHSIQDKISVEQWLEWLKKEEPDVTYEL